MRPLRVLLTGGPGGGKSSALSQLRSMLMKRSFNVFVLEENATRVIEAAGGYDPSWRQRDKLVRLQQSFLFFQRAQEDVFTRMSEIKDGRTIILLDRGILDGKVFVDHELWPEIIAGEGIDEPAILSRYDLILHMTSVAVDRPELYEFGPGSNNPARFHDVHEARVQDGKCVDVYKSHPRVVYVRTCESFEEKIAQVLQVIEGLCNEFFGSHGIEGGGLRNLHPGRREKIPVLSRRDTQGTGPNALEETTSWEQRLAALQACGHPGLGPGVDEVKQLVSLVVPVKTREEGARASIIATLAAHPAQAGQAGQAGQAEAAGATGTALIALIGKTPFFFEHRFTQGERTARKTLTAREFLLELEALQAAADAPIPTGAVIKRQLCWTASHGAQYFSLTRYTDAVDGSALDDGGADILDKPVDAEIPEALRPWLSQAQKEEDEELVASTPPVSPRKQGTPEHATGRSRSPVLKAHCTVDACHLAEVKRRRIHE